MHDGKLVFQPVGQQSFTVDERDATFLPEGLTVAQPDKLGNDATIVGELEPTTYVRDYFIGDGVDAWAFTFHGRHSAWLRSRCSKKNTPGRG